MRNPITQHAERMLLGGDDGSIVPLYETITGQLPFPNEANHAALLHRQLHDPVPAVRLLRADVPEAVDDVIRRATEKSPADRHPLGRPVPVGTRARHRNGFRGCGGAALVCHSGCRRTTKPVQGSPLVRRGERLVDQLVIALAQHRLVAVVGPSGSGKSSVVQAGLLPALRRGRVPGSADWYFSNMIPGRHPFEALEGALLRVATTPLGSLLEQLTAGGCGLARALRQVLPDRGELLLVIDQFEELFTLSDPTVARQLIDALVAAVTEERSRVRVVLTLRADFFDRPLRHDGLGRLIRDATVTVLPLQADELERAIVEPAAAVGCEPEPGLVSEIVADVSDQPGALPLLQYALTELWERRVSELLTRDAYRELGGVAGALARRAEELYSTSDNVLGGGTSGITPHDRPPRVAR